MSYRPAAHRPLQCAAPPRRATRGSVGRAAEGTRIMRRRGGSGRARVRALVPVLRVAAGAVAGIPVLAILSGGVGRVALAGASPIPSRVAYPGLGRLFLPSAPRNAADAAYPAPT